MGRYKTEISEPGSNDGCGPGCSHDVQLNKEEVFEIPADSSVILKFETNDCPYCKELDENINSSRDPKVPIMRINVNEHPMNFSLAQDNGITKFPTLVLLENGEEKSRVEGAISSEEFYLFAKQ